MNLKFLHRRSAVGLTKALAAVALMMFAVGARADAPASGPAFLTGGTMSHVNEREADGFVYRNEAGDVEDPFVTLKKAGATCAQFDLWTGHDHFRSLAPVTALALRAQKAGLIVSINFFYSDDYSNNLPRDWPSDMPALLKRVYDYTQDTLKSLAAVGVHPALVKIGNEIDGTYRDGFLMPVGSISKNNDNFIALLKAGCKATRDFDASIRIQIHSAARLPQKSLAFFRNVIDKGVDFDIMAQSWYDPGQGNLEKLHQNLQALASAFDKNILVTETSAHWSDKPVVPQPKPLRFDPAFPATPEGQADFLRSMMKEVASLPNGRGAGVLYWPTAYVTTAHLGGGDGGTIAFWDSTTGRAIPSIHVWGERPIP